MQLEGDEAVHKLYEQPLKQPELVLAYHPQCPYCRNFEPEFKKAVKNLKGYKVDIVTINMSKINDLQNSKLAVEGYPTVRLYQEKGKFKEYQGQRNADGLKAFLEENGIKK